MLAVVLICCVFADLVSVVTLVLLLLLIGKLTDDLGGSGRHATEPEAPGPPPTAPRR
jgi:hypothetical protein